MTDLERTVVRLQRDASISFTYLLRVLDGLIPLPAHAAREAALEAAEAATRLVAQLTLLTSPEAQQDAVLEEARTRLLACVREVIDGGE